MEFAVIIDGMKDPPASCNRCPFKNDGSMDGPDYCAAMVAAGKSYFNAHPDIDRCPLKRIIN